jgi:membrane-associated protein
VIAILYPTALPATFFWVSFFTYGGYYFGNIPFVKNNLSYFIIAIVAISLTPGFISFLHQRRSKARA